VPEAEVARLQAMGAWLKLNGEAIYGTSATLFTEPTGTFSPTEKDKRGNPVFTPTWNWRSTTAANKIYVEIFNWPAGAFHLANVPRKVTKAYLLADSAHAPLKLTQSGAGLDVQLPAKPLDPIATVLVLETSK
jgi:alpha-L-fucosidase